MFVAVRFDLIFLMLDPEDELFDRKLASHLVSLYYKDSEQEEQEMLVSSTSLSYFNLSLFLCLILSNIEQHNICQTYKMNHRLANIGDNPSTGCDIKTAPSINLGISVVMRQITIKFFELTCHRIGQIFCEILHLD